MVKILFSQNMWYMKFIRHDLFRTMYCTEILIKYLPKFLIKYKGL